MLQVSMLLLCWRHRNWEYQKFHTNVFPHEHSPLHRRLVDIVQGNIPVVRQCMYTLYMVNAPSQNHLCTHGHCKCMTLQIHTKLILQIYSNTIINSNVNCFSNKFIYKLVYSLRTAIPKTNIYLFYMLKLNLI